MKFYHLIAIAFLYCAAPVNGQDAPADSTKASVATLEPKPKKKSDCRTDNNTRHDIRWMMFDVGITTYLHNDAFNLPQSLDVYELDYSRSYHVNCRVFEQRINFDRKGFVSVSQGLSVEWQNYSFINDYVFEPKQPVVTPVLSETPFSKNRLLTQLVSVPIELHIESNPRRLSRSFHLSAGVTGGFLYGANQKTKNEDNGDKNKVRDDFNLNKFRLGWIGRIGYGPINFYVANSITPLFKTGEGPELIPIQIGLTIIPY